MSIIAQSIKHLEIIEGETDKIKCSSPKANLLLIEAKSEVIRAIRRFQKLAVEEGELKKEDIRK